MRIQETIATKRDGGSLSDAQIQDFIKGYTKGDITDYQASALLMATYIQGMDDRETATLTAAMAESGEQIDLSHLAQGCPTIDKHSTGGVGDKASLIVVPILAAAGANVCKMSGRGLGHTGGTLDKLESIPGFRVGLTPEEMVHQVANVGACLAGQTDQIAPADKKLYALRDATATVECLPLIVSSILSKKLAGGAKHLLFDVKVGNGALLKTPAEARQLAQALVNGAKANGRKAVAVLSDMNQPLGFNVGNALEIQEAIDVLNPRATGVNTRLRQLCITLANEGLKMIGRPASAEKILKSGAAFEKFQEIVEAQGGDVSMITDSTQLPVSSHGTNVSIETDGYISAINTEEIGNIVVSLGGGRLRKEDSIDPGVGLIVLASIGSRVRAGEIICQILAGPHQETAEIASRVRAAFTLSTEPVTAPVLIHEIIYS